MIVGYIVIGTIAGFITFLTAMLLGVSFWPALLLYSLAGSVGIIIVPLIRLTVDMFMGRPVQRMNSDFADVATNSRSAEPIADPGGLTGDMRSQSMRILAVDDDSFILELIPMISEKAGFSEVTPASSGELALEVLANTDRVFDCLLFDINMPGMDGIELCTRVRKIPAYRRTPIIMLTARRDMEYLDRAFRAGATDYTTKPFDIADLGARLRFAQEAINAQKRLPTAVSENQQPSSNAVHDHAFDLSDEVRIEGVKDLVTCTALTNYLTQLPSAELTNIQVFAVKIDQIEAIYTRATTEVFIRALRTVADAVGGSVRASGGLMTYAGNGVFLIVCKAANLRSSISMETEIQDLLADMNFRYDSGDLIGFEISVGEPVVPDAAKAQRARITFDRAIARAENRAIAKQGGPIPLSIHRRGA